jgi:hypothetical protein
MTEYGGSRSVAVPEQGQNQGTITRWGDNLNKNKNLQSVLDLTIFTVLKQKLTIATTVICNPLSPTMVSTCSV